MYYILLFIENKRRNERAALPDKLAPKILYAPNTTTTRDIMYRANTTFATIEFILEWMEQIDNCSKYFLQNTNASDPTIVTIRSILSNFSDNSDIDAVRQMQDLLDENNPNNLWHILEDVSATSESIQKSIRYVDWDIFYPINSEEELLQIAENQAKQKELGISSVFGAVVFSDTVNEKPLRNVTMAIRMNSTYVHETNRLKEK